VCLKFFLKVMHEMSFTLAVDEVTSTCCWFLLYREDKMDNFGRFIRSLDDSIRHLYCIGDANAKRHQDRKLTDSDVNSSFILYSVADPDILFGGPRGAEGAEGAGVWGDPLTGGRAWGGGYAPYSPLPRKLFQSFIKKWRVLVDSDV